MRRKPIQIMAGLINALNSYSKDEEYSINKIHEDTNYHWNTVNDYVKLILLVKNFAPDLKLRNETNDMVITKHSPYFKNLDEMEQLIVYLFNSKAFDEQSAIEKEKLMFTNRSNPSNLRIPHPFNEFIRCTHEKRCHLTLKGKFRAQGILASIYKTMIDFIEKETDITRENASEHWLKTFYDDDEKESHLVNTRIPKENGDKQDMKSEEKDELAKEDMLTDLMRHAGRGSFNISTEHIA